MDGTNLYCLKCKTEYERLVNGLTNEVFCICPNCYFKDSDIMNEQEIERWKKLTDKMFEVTECK